MIGFNTMKKAFIDILFSFGLIFIKFEMTPLNILTIICINFQVIRLGIFLGGRGDYMRTDRRPFQTTIR